MAGAFFKTRRATLFRTEAPVTGQMWEDNQADNAGSFMREKVLRFTPMPGSYSLAFFFVLLFTLTLYLRPNELFPHFFAAFPIQLGKTFAIIAPIIFFASRLLGGEKLFLMTKELKMVFIIFGLAILFYPISINREDTYKELNELYSKVVLIFALMIGTIDSRRRIYWMFRVMIGCGAWIAIDTINKYRTGELSELSKRVVGTVGGMFSNPNDLATTFDMLLPLAVVMMVVSRGLGRVFYAFCVFLFAMATLITFSRGGFLSLVCVAGVMLWKFRKRHRAIPMVAAILLCSTLLLSMPGGFGERLMTIIAPNSDSTGSAQERRDILKRGTLRFLRNPLRGIGVGTFHIISIKERRAHNAYLEIAVELGVFGLVAYLVLLFYPLKGLLKIERETVGSKDPNDLENYVLSVGLQATLVAYYANSFFASIQYQWFVYYPIAFAVGLRRLYEREVMVRERINAPARLVEHHVGDELRGTIWQQGRDGAVWHNPAIEKRGALIGTAPSARHATNDVANNDVANNVSDNGAEWEYPDSELPPALARLQVLGAPPAAIRPNVMPPPPRPRRPE